MWGRNVDGECGARPSGSNPNVMELPYMVRALESVVVVKVACGRGFTHVLDAAGNVYAFGRANTGALGLSNLPPGPSRALVCVCVCVCVCVRFVFSELGLQHFVHPCFHFISSIPPPPKKKAMTW